MANLASSKKRIRQEAVRRRHNASIKSSMRTAIKKAEQADDGDTLSSVMNRAYSALDKAAKRRIIHPRNAARKKSRLMKMASAKQAS